MVQNEAAAYGHISKGLELEALAVSKECTLDDGQQGTVGLPVIHRSAEDKAVGMLGSLAQAVAHIIIKHASALCRLATTAAGYAAPHGLGAQLQYLALYSLGLQRACHFAQRHIGIALTDGATVD